MRRTIRGLLATAAAVLLVTAPACGGDGDKDTTSADNSQVEVFSWWTGPGEEEGLNAMIELFKKENPGVEFTNAAVAGGAGTQAQQVLDTRLQSNNPPDSFQAHAGQELASYIRDGKVEDLTFLYDREGWRDKFNKGLMERITVDNKIYSVPVNIHRSNLLWYLPATLSKAGIAAPPKNWTEFLTQARALQNANVTPLSVGPAWAQIHLMENVLLGELGVAKYNQLWDGSLDWKSPDVIAALNVFKQVMAVSDVKSAAADWQPALDKVVDGTAAYNVMGDWANAYLSQTKELAYQEAYNVSPTPGSDGVYNFLSDSFTLPVDAPHRGAAEKWLLVAGSVAGQDAFNPLKGSVPARLDIDKSKYTGYLATALADWQNPSTTVVGSFAHGAVANKAWKSEVETAYGLYAQDWNTEKFAAAVSASYQSVGK